MIECVGEERESVSVAEVSPTLQGEVGVSGRTGLPGKPGVKVGSQGHLSTAIVH